MLEKQNSFLFGIAPNKVSVFALSAVVELSEFTHLFPQSWEFPATSFCKGGRNSIMP